MVNPYELADKLESFWLTKNDDLLIKAVTMLRQQAGELEYYKVRDSSHIKIIKEQADRIAELEKQTFFIADPEKQGEPVAWMELYYGEPNNLAWTDAELRDSGEIYKTVPLYTSLVFCKAPQLKPLSDEEMKELINNFPIIFSPQDLLTFARAIEERHGIK